MPGPKILFLVEGNTDIRFVTGLSGIGDLTMVVPRAPYEESELKQRVESIGVKVKVDEIAGGRFRYQLNSLAYLLRRAREFDVILSQEILRGSLSGTIVGAVRGVPVLTYMCIAPVEYFRCRYERGHCNWPTWKFGETVIRLLMTINGRLAARAITLGPYLRKIAAPYCPRIADGYYYGVDCSYYQPVSEQQKRELREKLHLPRNQFLILLSSRISHEKDPETVLRAVKTIRSQGVEAVLLNLGGGYEKFLQLARDLTGENPEEWVCGRKAAHPMTELAEYYQAADCVAQASLAEGLGLSPLEALACGVPAVCTAVGGLAANLNGYARLIPRRDFEKMAGELAWVAAHPKAARAQALEGRGFVIRQWSREKAFQSLADVIAEVLRQAK